MSQCRVLVVDDEETAREELVAFLVESGFDVSSAATAEEGLTLASEMSFDVCLSDIRMPGMDGIELLKQLREQSPETMVILVTAYGDLDTAITAIRSGAMDYVLKPILFEDILAKVKHLAEHQQLTREIQALRRSSSRAGHDLSMIGESPAMQRVVELVQKVAPTPSNVLITGESGTGKELIARAIHDLSDRQESPFVPINCAAIPETLLESELFGHVKGSFTGAVANKEGLLRTAGTGTILLDELGELPLALQAKLLRAIESREIQPVGSTKLLPIQARIVAATNRDLKLRVSEGLFREDLYYRMAVFEIEVPPLRQRTEDIPELVRHFIQKYNVELKRHVKDVSSEALAALTRHEWHGNIRELENTIERALILAPGDYLGLEELPHALREGSQGTDISNLTLAEATQQFERTVIEKMITTCSGDKREAARRLGVSLSSLYRKLEIRKAPQLN